MFHSNGRSRRRSPAVGRLFLLEPCGRWHRRLTAYIVREHQRGRTLGEILGDRFVVEHASDAAITHLLEDPGLIHQLAHDCRIAHGVHGDGAGVSERDL